VSRVLAGGEALAGLAAFPSAALAGPTITAQPDNVFSPKNVTVPLGDSVTFTNGGGTHNVAWDDKKVRTLPAIDGQDPPWTITPRTFTKPGLYPYYVTVHGGPGGFEMSGKITVRNADGSKPRRPAIGRTATVIGRGRVSLS